MFTFLDDGSMLVSVGGATNAGVPVAEMGGSQESPLSAAIVRANYLKSGYNGTITYTKWDEKDLLTTKQTGGDVSVYASGLRNCFGMTRSLAGIVYATDNGANTGFGPASTSCSTEGDEPNVPDSLFIVEKGNYYGHANRNRGRQDKRQCVWRGKGTSPPIARMTSSTNAVVAYTGSAFGGKLNNTLFLTKMAWFGQPGKVLRADLSDDGQSIVDGPYEVWGDSGLSLVQGSAGELVMPQLKERRVMVLFPEIRKSKAKASVKSASGPEVHFVHPPRGHSSGGAEVLVSGERFEDIANVRFGFRECSDVRIISSSQLRCRIPPGIGGVEVSVESNDGLASTQNGINFVYAG